MKRFAWLATTCLSLALPLAAHAFDGVIADDVDLRAGPDVGYPAVTALPAGAPVSIQGCIDGWTWCDVIAGPDRGWVAGTYVQQTYGGQPEFITDYGARIGIPIVAFSLGLYWDRYYHGRPWYGARNSWAHRSFGYRLPPQPHNYHGGAYHGGPYRGGAHGPVHAGAYNHGGPRTNIAHGPVNRDVHAGPAHNNLVNHNVHTNTAHAPVAAHNVHAAPAHAPAHTEAAHRSAPPAREHDDKNHH